MKFKKYQHIERLGNTEVNGILDGMCYIFPKIDGTNSNIWMDEGKLKAGSRNRELTLDQDNAGFYASVLENDNIINFFKKVPDYRLYGEWLVPHTLKTYEENAWRIFYVFDVKDENDNYVPYDIYSNILDFYEISYIPPICKIENPTEERLQKQLEKNTFLIRDGAGTGEGIVIKNYDFVNRYGNIVWAKIVRNEFKEQNKKAFGIPEITEVSTVEKNIVNKFITETLVNKEFAKIEDWTSKKIPQLLGVIFYCLINEEMWNILRAFKNCKIDFSLLNKYTTLKIKELKPELFR